MANFTDDPVSDGWWDPKHVRLFFPCLQQRPQALQRSAEISKAEVPDSIERIHVDCSILASATVDGSGNIDLSEWAILLFRKVHSVLRTPG